MGRADPSSVSTRRTLPFNGCVHSRSMRGLLIGGILLLPPHGRVADGNQAPPEPRGGEMRDLVRARVYLRCARIALMFGRLDAAQRYLDRYEAILVRLRWRRLRR
jgi:hypothetical protein